MARNIYRGYEIEHHKERGWLVYLNDQFLCAQPSEEFALSWVDRDRKERAAKQK